MDTSETLAKRLTDALRKVEEAEAAHAEAVNVWESARDACHEYMARMNGAES